MRRNVIELTERCKGSNNCLKTSAIWAIVVHQYRLARLAPDRVRLGARPTPANEPACRQADVTRLRRELKWAPRFDLRRGIADTLDWWKANRPRLSA